MKTKNNLLTGIIIGIGVIIVPLILMGTTSYTTEKQNKYEFHISPEGYGVGIMLNTETGETWYISNTTKKKH